MPERLPIEVRVNGTVHRRAVEPRLLLTDFLRHELGLVGTHVGCEHGVCGACTVLLDGSSVRSCLLLAVQTNGRRVRTVEGLAPGPEDSEPTPGSTAAGDGEALHPLQAAFQEAHGLQCGFCTPGILMTLVPFLEENPRPTREEIRHAIAGNLCRCTGYRKIVDAVELAARWMAGSDGPAGRGPGAAGGPEAGEPGLTEPGATEPGPTEPGAAP